VRLSVTVEPRGRLVAWLSDQTGQLLTLREDGTYALGVSPERMLQSEQGTTRALGRLLLDQRGQRS
jgi:hypothetical protein